MGYFFNNDINETFIIEPLSLTGGSPTVSACTAVFTDSIVSCSSDTVIEVNSGITINSDVKPTNDNELYLGTPVKRFRELNTLSGNSVTFNATNKITTPTLDLGLDTQGNSRQITANNSIIQDDTLFGGTF